MNKQRVLITGGAGFIGSHLARLALAQGCEVTCIDNLYSGFTANIAPLYEDRNFKFVEHDIIEPWEGTYDLILNFACPASPVHYQAEPIFTLKTCVYGTLNMLELARKTKARILHASTSEIYGDPELHPQPESYWGRVNCTGIRSCYDEGKRAAETLCFDYLRRYNTDVRLIRIFNTYGPHMNKDDGRVVSNLIVQALQGQPLTIYGDGSQTRSFCFVTDLVDGIDRIASAPREKISGPYNLGRDEEFTVLDLARKVQQLTGTASAIEKKPLPSDDPRQRRPDLSKVKSTFNWTPKVTLEEGLRSTIAYFRTVLL